MSEAKLSHRKGTLIGIALPLLMLLFATIACDLERSMGELTDAAQTFDAIEAWGHDWRANVTPGREYEVTVAAVDSSQPTVFAILIVMGGPDEENGSWTDGYVTTDGITTRFVAGESGRVTIRVHVRHGNAQCTIQLREVP